MKKLLIGMLIGVGITFTGVVFANQWGFTGQSFYIPVREGKHPEGYNIHKMRDGNVVCYVVNGALNYMGTGGGPASKGIPSISCLVESR